MPPKSKPESQQPTAKKVLDDTAEQSNSGAPVSSDPAPGATDAGDGQPLAAISASVAGPSSTDTPGPSILEVPQPNSSGSTSSDSAPGATDTGGGQPLAPALTPVTGAPSTDTPGPTTVEYPELPRYQVTGMSSIQHDGSWYEAGDDIYLSDRDARGLLDGRFIVPTEEFQP